MRFAPEPVKLPIANVGRFPTALKYGGVLACSLPKTPPKQIYSSQLRHFEERPMRHGVSLTKTGASRISPRNCPRWPGFPGAAHLGRRWSVLGRPASPD